MNPHIELKFKPVNKNVQYNDPGFDPTIEAAHVFHVIVSENRLKLVFTVKWQSPTGGKREYEVIRHDGLFLDGIDEGIQYPMGGHTGKISANPTIVQELFSRSLDPYSIVLDKIIVHKMTYFESINYRFTDEAKREQLYDLINQECLKSRASV